MAELLTRTGALDGWAGRFAALPDSVSILAEPFHSMAVVRLVSWRPHQTGPAPTSSTWTEREGTTAVWLGPDEVLLTSPFRTAAELGGTDVSAQRTTIRLRGAHARDVLETGCAIDLHPRSFGAGSAAVTMLAQANVILLCLGDNDYRILVRSSFAAYLAEWLIDAAHEFSTVEY
jgi:sarcosine oxidase, subunit gamma